MMNLLVQYFCTLLVTMEFGLTKTGRVAHRTMKLPCIRPDATREDILFFIDILRPTLAGKITSVKLVREKVTTVWSPEMREEEGEVSAQERTMMARSVQSSGTASFAGAGVPAPLPQVEAVDPLTSLAFGGAVMAAAAIASVRKKFRRGERFATGGTLPAVAGERGRSMPQGNAPAEMRYKYSRFCC